MRDPNRIPEILKQIQDIWVENPDLRLFQLLENSVPTGTNTYYLEDNKLQELLNETYRKDM